MADEQTSLYGSGSFYDSTPLSDAQLAQVNAAQPTEAVPVQTVEDQSHLASAQNIIQQYSGYPGVSQAFAAMVTANAQNPERLAALAQQMVEQIEQVKSNPHVRQPVDPSIAQAVEEIRKVELEKPDPLNLLRPEGQQTEAKRGDDTKEIQSIQGGVFGLAALGAAAEAPAAAAFTLGAMPEASSDRATQTEKPTVNMFHALSTGAALEALGGQFSPQADLPAQQRSREVGRFA